MTADDVLKYKDKFKTDETQRIMPIFANKSIM